MAQLKPFNCIGAIGIILDVDIKAREKKLSIFAGRKKYFAI